MRRLVLLCLLFAVTPATALAAAPTVTGSSANPVGATEATLRATVNPRGEETTYHFEYGTDTSLGMTTADRSAGDGTTAVEVSDAATGLSPDTTYYFRVVATNADAAEPVRGPTRSFHTLELPGASTLGTRDTRIDGTTLLGRVNPNRSETTYSFEWGRTTAYGAQTEAFSAGRGSMPVDVAVVLNGLATNTAYHYRLVATNAAGTRRGSDRRFRTLRQPTGISIVVPATTVRFGSALAISGKVEGQGVSGVRVGLQASPFPFAGGFLAAGNPVRTAADGTFRLVSPPLWISTQLQVVAKTTLQASSAPVTVYSRPIVGGTTIPVSRRAMRLEGLVTPRIRGAKVTVQVRRGKRWVTTVRTKTRSLGRGRFGYRATVSRVTKTRRYRVVVTPRNKAYVRATSATLSVPRR